MTDNSAQAAVLVCGGAGYIGSHVVRTLCQAGREVIVVDDLSTGHREALDARATFCEGSIGDRAFLDGVFAAHRIESVMHFCAYAYVGESVENPRKYFENNISQGLVLLGAMLDHDVRRLVFSSSCTVYGCPATSGPIDEATPHAPLSPYGRTKSWFESILSDYAHAYGLGWMALRYFNAAGASLDTTLGEEHDPETHLIPLVLREALRTRAGGEPAETSLRVFGDDYDTPDGTCVRDYIHVEDLAEAHLSALAHLAAGGESGAVNLANQRGYSVREVIEAARAITGEPIEYAIAPRRAGDPPILVGLADRAREKLGWSASHSDLNTILQSAWDWHSR